MKTILSLRPAIIWFIITSLFIVTRHDKTDEEFHADPADYPYVVQLQLQDATGIVEMEGIFVQNDWIITAAHGLTSVEPQQAVKLFDRTFTVTQILLHPEWEGFENDIALIQLERPEAAVDPIPLYQKTDETGKEITIMGRGWHGTGLTGPASNDQIFRLATNRIDSVSEHWIKFRFDEPNHPNATELEGISGPGDSGGPAFISIGGTDYLAGISSNQVNEQIGVEKGHYGVMEYYTRVSSYIPWINQVISGESEPPSVNEVGSVPNSEWNFPASEIGEKATLLMDAIAVKQITDSLMEEVFYKNFRESFNLKGFVRGITNNLDAPEIVEIRRARRNVLIFTIRSNENTYLMQLEADRRDDYKIGGLIFKRIND